MLSSQRLRNNKGIALRLINGICFLVIAIAQLLHVFNIAEPESNAFDNEISRNPYVWGAVALCGVILMAAMFIEPLAAVLSLESIDQRGWLLVVIASSIPLIVGRAHAVFRSGR